MTIPFFKFLVVMIRSAIRCGIFRAKTVQQIKNTTSKESKLNGIIQVNFFYLYYLLPCIYYFCCLFSSKE